MVLAACDNEPLAFPFDRPERALRSSGTQVHAAFIIRFGFEGQRIGALGVKAREVQMAAVVERKMGSRDRMPALDPVLAALGEQRESAVTFHFFGNNRMLIDDSAFIENLLQQPL
ncbi:hypothetical protein D3C71_1539560 [compost metagenome]